MDYDKFEKICLRLAGLIALNVIAFVFDGQFIYFAAGCDAIAFGVSLKDLKP